MAIHPDKKRTFAQKEQDRTRNQKRQLKRRSRAVWFQKEIGPRQQYILTEPKEAVK
jgi:hypothetical protein